MDGGPEMVNVYNNNHGNNDNHSHNAATYQEGGPADWEPVMEDSREMVAGRPTEMQWTSKRVDGQTRGR